MTCRRAFLFQRSRIMRNAAQKAFACLSSERGRVGRAWPSPALSKDKMAFAKERRRTKSFRDPKEHLFCSPQSARFSRQKGPAALDAPQGRIACRRQNMAQPCRTASPTHILGENSRSIYPAYHRGRRRRRTEDKTLPHTVSRLQRYMRYIINDLRRRPFFPPHMGCLARAPHPPLFRQTRQLSGCFRPPMRRLRAEMDAIAHARDNSRPSDGCRACRHSGRLAHCGRCQIHASSTDRSLSAIRHFSALREKPMPRFSMRGESIPDERGLCFSRDSAHFVRHQIGSDIKRIVFNRRTRRASRRPPSVAAAQRPNRVQDARTDGARSQPSSFPSVSVPFPFSYKCRNSTAQKVKSHSSAVSSA